MIKENREFIEKNVQLWSKGRILVLGCGDGFEVKVLNEMGWDDAVGVTFTNEEYWGAKAQNVNVIKADIHELPFNDKEFDYVISKETLEHMLCPYIALYEINRVMKVDAKFVHYIPHGMEKQRDWYHYNCFPDWMWIDYFHKLDFVVTEVKTDIMQLRYEGFKKKDKDLSVPVPMYSLSDYRARVRKMP